MQLNIMNVKGDKMEELIVKLREEFKGYHIDINIYPSGGRIELNGCEECGTEDDSSLYCSWRIGRAKLKDIDDAIAYLKQKMKTETNKKEIKC